MNFKEKTTTISISKRSRKIIKKLIDEIKEKTGTHVSVAEFIEYGLNKTGEAVKNKIIKDYLAFVNDEEKNEI